MRIRALKRGLTWQPHEASHGGLHALKSNVRPVYSRHVLIAEGDFSASLYVMRVSWK